MILEEKPSIDELMHYGTPRHSGRYPWGSGEDPYQHSGDFISRYQSLKKEGKTEKEIADAFELSVDDLRSAYSVAKNTRRNIDYERAKSLIDKGYSTYKVGEMMGIAESTVRSLLDPNAHARSLRAKATYDVLKKEMESKKYLDISEGVERDLGISKERLNEAVYMLRMEGYEVYPRQIEQLTNPGKKTSINVLCMPGTDFQEFIRMDEGNIKTVIDYKSTDGGETFHPPFVYPKSMDSKRLQIRYKEDGGIEKDGIIELRRGVEDLSLGEDRYAQVRILVDNTHYLKGMAVYSDNMPDGVDVIFNTNKTKDVSKMDVLKKIKDDPDNPFGSAIKENGGQYYYIDKDGNEQLGLINKRASQGDWNEWSNNLPSQFLSKQSKELAKRQLNLKIDQTVEEYNEICSLTNPTVKKKLLADFADGCDSNAVHLKAAALPRQQFHVIIPFTSLKDNEIYAPNYKDGETVALIRYPHGGTFEIPKLVVNNKNPEAIKILGRDTIDAVGINSKVAERLSGADFDGDTVMVIPTNDKVKITTKDPLKGLEGFDPKVSYALNEIKTGKKDSKGKEIIKYCNDDGKEVKTMSKAMTGTEMGKISNLITDMTLQGATDDELARAVRHSMVVIDAEKHHLDYKRSESDNDIISLKKRYQRTYDEEKGEKYGGASTLISRAKSEVSIEKRKGSPIINTPYYNSGRPNPYYDPNKPEGSLLYKKADNTAYAEKAKNPNKPELLGYKLSDGKSLWIDKDVAYYDIKGNKKELIIKDREKYDYYKPVKKIDKVTGETYFTNKTGEITYRTKLDTQKSTKMMETDDARTLVSYSRSPMELIYADYANKMKSLANQARKEIIATGDIQYSKEANIKYMNEVNSLKAKYNESAKNKTRERAAQLAGTSRVNAKIQSNPDISKKEIKKLKDQSLQKARLEVGAKRKKIEITDREWEAIQSGAVNKTLLNNLLKFVDMDIIREKAMPKSITNLSSAQLRRVNAMLSSGKYTYQQVADAIGVSISTIRNVMKGDN